MKILAVIPARAGSKGIPNKNIRILGGHPLIFYSIKNAMDSNYITDIVVTTDSMEVAIVATQLGVGYKWRDAALCGDDVTLDAVVYDAIPQDNHWDYVVTMQPTSPTLGVKTLDRAIEETISQGLDTMISVINRPHLSWGLQDDIIKPNYMKRANRQCLPPHYMETGAFVISKANAVTPYSRIGTKVSVFEVPPDESYDVDSFDDLRNVASRLSPETVGIYVNGNNKRGIGHIYRALELADEFFVKPDIYYDTHQTNRAVFGETTHQLIPVNGIAELFNICKKKNYQVFINDILTTSIDYMIGLRTVLPSARIINFEDDGEGAVKADLVFNALYQSSDASNVYAGEKYYISSKTFMFYQPIHIKEKVENVFISFGGADPQNYSDRLLAIISKPQYSQYHFTVVLGRAKENVDYLMDKYKDSSNINLLYDVSNMPELMSKCDISITSRGRTGYELAILGIPTIAMAQNKREEKHGFVSNENGFSYIGLNPADEIIEANLNMYLVMSTTNREHYQQMLLSHDLRNGRQKVMSLIHSK